MKLCRHTFETPVGPMMALASDEALCALEFWNPGRMTRLDARLRRWFVPCVVEDGVNDLLLRTGGWLAGYFGGTPLPDPPLDMRGAPFELRVWAALRTIPHGQTASYGEIARRVGSPGASRAVGMANGSNPIAVIVPCHRVIGANGALTGYGGGLDRKAWLLDHENSCGATLSGSPDKRATKKPARRDSPAASGRLPLGD